MTPARTPPRTPRVPASPGPLAGIVRRDAEGLQHVAGRVLADLEALVPRMGEAYRREIPEYEHLAAEEIERDVLPVSREVVEEFFSRILSHGEPDPTAPPDLRQAGRRRLEMGVPLDSALHAFRIAGREVWNAVVASTRPGDEHVLAELAGAWIEYVDRISSAFAEAYLSASHEQLRRVDARRRAVLDAVLSAADAAELAAVASRWSLTLARAYVPVLAEGEEVSGRIDRVLDLAPAHSLGGFRGQRLVLLVPAPGAEIERLARAAGLPLVARGSAVAAGPALAAEVARTEGLLDAAVASGVAAGVFGPDDLLIPQLVAGNPQVAEALRRRIVEPLSERADDSLLSTLRGYLETGSVPATARAECVHVNTVAYRLKRVRELVGLDPRVPSEAALLVLALSAADCNGGG